MQPIHAAAMVRHAPALGWGLPFLGVLLSIALVPAIAPRFWHRRMALVVGVWTVGFLVAEGVASGPSAAVADAWHAILTEYLPFVSLLVALFTAGGGVLVRGGFSGTPAGNTGLMALGTVLAGFMGTTGAAMVLIHPLLRANAHRARKTHIAVFFTLLVANAGGALSPLGDPPLYLGYLRGVPFFWPLLHIGLPLLVLAVVMLTAFWALDKHYARLEPPPQEEEKLRIRGWGNAALIVLVAAVVLAMGLVDLGDAELLGQHIAVSRLVGIGIFAVIAVVSARFTPRAIHQGNDFSWHPMVEVAVLFVAIFITIEPVLKMLEAGLDGPMAPVLRLTLNVHGHPEPLAYFWLAGLLSSFLDNAPTYLVFFDMAHIQPPVMTPEQTLALEALSAGAVFFGGLSYIGNAPNMMVRGIASHRGVRMPGFFGYFTAASLVSLPVFALITVVFFI